MALIRSMMRAGIACALLSLAATSAFAQEDAAANDDAHAATDHYAKMEEAYLEGDWIALKAAFLKTPKHSARFNREQRMNWLYMRKTSQEFRPTWWDKTKSSSAVSFRARIWRKSFTANYMPTRALGFSAPVDIHRGRVRVIVSWMPNLVDNPQPADGTLAKVHGIKKGHIGEAIVWHELGHNYITTALPARSCVKLYMNHGQLFHHCQEFYADMTSIYHASTKARIAAMLLRLDGLSWYDELECHTRGAHAIGALLLSHWLDEPEKWPSVHLPGELPEKDVELKTLLYVYENLDPEWTVTEDRALRKLVDRFLRAHGENVLRKKGELTLNNRLKMKLMASEDRTYQAKRNQWVSEKLAAAIKGGRADKPRKQKQWTRGDRIEIPWRVVRRIGD